MTHWSFFSPLSQPSSLFSLLQNLYLNYIIRSVKLLSKSQNDFFFNRLTKKNNFILQT